MMTITLHEDCIHVCHVYFRMVFKVCKSSSFTRGLVTSQPSLRGPGTKKVFRGIKPLH